MIRIIGEDMIDATDWNYKHIAYETDLAGEFVECPKFFLRKR